ncbi:MAG TPA: iron-sulfur cluster assembly protein [Rubrobacteraceae bacterium]|nr:iron-sulfur cluster assembly protein [Rubrobacteraceae bacterium]
MKPTEVAVLHALSSVRDPELDEPITDLKFIADLRVAEDMVSVRLRLPTPFCAPNFAYLMAADAKAALLSVPGVRHARVVLEDHHASSEINAGMADERGFEATFPGNTEGEDLDELRDIFRRKSFVSRQERMCQALLAEGYTPTQLAKMPLGDPPTSTATEKYLSRREELGLDVSAAAPLLVDPDGNRIPEDSVVEHLRFARLTRISIEGNAGMCRGLLAARYGIPDPEEEVRA